MHERTIPVDPKEVLNDGQEHRFIFGPKTTLLVQQDSVSPQALSHLQMAQEYMVLTSTAKGGKLIIKNGEYTLTDKKSATLPLPSLEEFEAALGRGVALV